MIHVDGGARGNPGPAGAGVVIATADGTLVFEAGYFLGHQTNNTAEYQALINALERAQHCGASSITVHSDSELLVKQITGEYQVKNPRLAGLYEQVQRLLLKVPRWTLRHVRREANRRADELANLAMDRRGDVVVFDVESGDVPPRAERPKAEQVAGPAAAPEGGAHKGPAVRAVRVSTAHAPNAKTCSAGGSMPASFTIAQTLPAGLCVHAVHAILPTVLAMLNTEPEEFAAIPTLTVRCAQTGCGGVFQLSPVQTSNGQAPRTPA